MRITLAGHQGQLGRTLVPLLEPTHVLLGVDLPEHDITNREAMLDLADAFKL